MNINNESNCSINIERSDNKSKVHKRARKDILANLKNLNTNIANQFEPLPSEFLPTSIILETQQHQYRELVIKMTDMSDILNNINVSLNYLKDEIQDIKRNKEGHITDLDQVKTILEFSEFLLSRIDDTDGLKEQLTNIVNDWRETGSFSEAIRLRKLPERSKEIYIMGKMLADHIKPKSSTFRPKQRSTKSVKLECYKCGGTHYANQCKQK